MGCSAGYPMAVMITPLRWTMNPLPRFAELMQQATDAGVELSNAVSLCTVDADARPWARTVLVKDIDERGVTFFTNQQSNKANALRANPRAAICVYWHAILMQVQLAGPVELLSELENDAYFATRARGSQVGAWASDQSRPLQSRHALLEAVTEQTKRFEVVEQIPRPAHWGGYRILADTVEIWHDGESRIHHRERYTRTDVDWEMRLLQP